MSMSVLPGRLGLLSRPQPLFPTPPLSISISVQSFIRVRLRRLPSVSASASESEAAPNPQSFGPDYLIHSCGLPPYKAVQAYYKLQHLNSPDNPDAVLQFLREMGIKDYVITRIVMQEPRILDSSVDNILRPNFQKLQEVGLSLHEISFIIFRYTNMFLTNLAPRIDFYLDLLGSKENVAAALRKWGALPAYNVQKVILPALRVLRDRCGLSSPQIVRLIIVQPRLLKFSHEFLEQSANKAEELGFERSSGMFIYALTIVSRLSPGTLDARLNNLKKLGFTQAEVTQMIRKGPMLLGVPEQLMNSKIEFLLKEAGCGKTDIVRNPSMLMCSLEKRLIPRNVVRKLLMARGIPISNNRFASFMIESEKRFMYKYVLPYERKIRGIQQAYADACAGKE